VLVVVGVVYIYRHAEYRFIRCLSGAWRRLVGHIAAHRSFIYCCGHSFHRVRYQKAKSGVGTEENGGNLASAGWYSATHSLFFGYIEYRLAYRVAGVVHLASGPLAASRSASRHM
jgi:hypothetical protein